MPARIIRLGHVEGGVVEEVRDGGRTLVVNGQTFTLRELTGQFALEDGPWYAVRLRLGAEP